MAEMTGDSGLARAVVPCTAAAVDHADTELIGHDGKPGDTGFLCSGKILISTFPGVAAKILRYPLRSRGCEKMAVISSQPLFLCLLYFSGDF